MNDADRDLLFVAMTAFDEASNQGAIGIRAVCWSIVNRHKAKTPSGQPRWYSRATLAGTCFLSYQYSSYNLGDPNRERGVETPLANPVYQTCMQEAADAIYGGSQDPTGGATHYYRQGTPEPLWVSGKNATGEQVSPPAHFLLQIGDELFYNQVS